MQNKILTGTLIIVLVLIVYLLGSISQAVNQQSTNLSSLANERIQFEESSDTYNDLYAPAPTEFPSRPAVPASCENYTEYVQVMRSNLANLANELGCIDWITPRATQTVQQESGDTPNIPEPIDTCSAIDSTRAYLESLDDFMAEICNRCIQITPIDSGIRLPVEPIIQE